MPRLSETASQISYPQLNRRRLDTIIALCMAAPESPGPEDPQGDVQDVLSYLIAFYTRRWGLPAALRSGRTDTGTT